jgi:predicted phage baseplate assembly protein
MEAHYRVGSGRIGNVGAGAIRHVVGGTRPILSVTNPLPAAGGSDPASLEETRIAAPAGLERQERGVTAEDLERLALRHPEVAAARAELRWAGSWHVARVAVERAGGREADEAFLKQVRDFLEPYRLAGTEIEVRAGRHAALDLAFRVWSYPAYPVDTVEAEILDALACGITRWGSPGFFHPSRWPFRRPVRFSEVARAILGVAGVARLEPVRFRRRGALALLPTPVDGDLIIPLDASERADVPDLEIQMEVLP